ncbi:myocyte-specific enhancer factor 2B-like [Durio zibethinus]|uniref:Myocyte-specific enhancer factor 2B-like n=1 Tax=Durio zibethinus TaxID=66656 RepID=A0A6P5YUH3_DURZI|nr:myocyte-specific enhancer factor 2B-like [Durio zibethinus]
MTRKKVKLAWIVNDSARRACLKKRRLGLLKKVSELTTLCGVDACLIVYSPNVTEPMFHKMPESERQKKMMNQETYLTDRVTKAQEQLTKYQRRNKGVEMNHLMNQIDQDKGLDELNLTELHGLTWLVEEKMKEMRKRIEFFQQVPFVTASPRAHGDLSLPPSSPADDLTARIGGASGGLGGDVRSTHAESLLWDQWFIDMMNNSEFKSGARSSTMRSDIGLPDYHPCSGSTADDRGQPRHSFGGSWSVAAEMGQPPYGNLRQPTSDLGLAPLSSGPHDGASDIGLPRGSAGSINVGPFGSDS